MGFLRVLKRRDVSIAARVGERGVQTLYWYKRVDERKVTIEYEEEFA
jgi:hypothetical protein